MLRFAFTQRNADAVTRNLREAASVADGRLTDVTYGWAQVVRARLKSTPYPARRPRQRYVRTGLLANSWRAERQGAGVLIANSAPYHGYVVGDAGGRGQAWMHRGRWWLGRDVVEEARPALREALVREMDRIL